MSLENFRCRSVRHAGRHMGMFAFSAVAIGYLNGKIGDEGLV